MSRSAARVALVALCAVAVACDKVALLAPTGSTVTVSVSATAIGSNGSLEVVATVIESAGTPVHNGTEVRFQASVGRMDPEVARTDGGIARATFHANGASGTARISAFSGGARAEDIEVRVGSAAAETVAVRTTPTSVPQTGGTVEVIATVRDISGNPLSGAQVVFSTDNGTLGAGNAVTDDSGEARTTLTTNRESNVRANVAGKEGTARVAVETLPTVGLSVSPQNPVAGVPVSITVTPGATTNGNPVHDVIIDFGDGTPPASLGAISGAQTVQHVYTRGNTYTISASVVDTAGRSNSSSTTVTVQSPTVAVTITGPATGDAGASVTFTATVSNPNNVPLSGVTVDFGNGRSVLLGPTGGSAVTQYPAPGDYTVRATATSVTGSTFMGTHIITIRPRAGLTVNLDAAVNENTNAFTCSATYPKTCQTTFSAFVPPPGVQPGVRVVFTAAVTGLTAASSFAWDFGDGSSTVTSGPNVDHLYTAPGTYVIRVRVTTTDGNVGEQHLTLLISP